MVPEAWPIPLKPPTGRLHIAALRAADRVVGRINLWCSTAEFWSRSLHARVSAQLVPVDDPDIYEWAARKRLEAEEGAPVGKSRDEIAEHLRQQSRGER